MKLNDNIHEMRTGLEKLANAVQHYEYKIACKTLKQTENLGNGLISKLCNELDVEYSKFEARMKEHKDDSNVEYACRHSDSIFIFMFLHSGLEFGVLNIKFIAEFTD